MQEQDDYTVQFLHSVVFGNDVLRYLVRFFDFFSLRAAILVSKKWNAAALCVFTPILNETFYVYLYIEDERAPYYREPCYKFYQPSYERLHRVNWSTTTFFSIYMKTMSN